MLDAPVSRRSFLAGALVLAAAAAVPAEAADFLAPVPELVGDGVHLDAAGLNALFAGEPVRILNGCARAMGDSFFLQGSFLVEDTIVISRPLEVDNLVLVAAPGFRGISALRLENCRGSHIGRLDVSGFPNAVEVPRAALAPEVLTLQPWSA